MSAELDVPYLGILFLNFSAAAHLSRRRWPIALAVATAGILVSVAFEEDPHTGFALVDVLWVTVMFLGLPFLAGRVMYNRAELQRSLSGCRCTSTTGCWRRKTRSRASRSAPGTARGCIPPPGRGCATRSGPSWGEPYRQIASRMLAAAWAARDAAEGHEAVCVSHQLPIWTLRRLVERKPLSHVPTQRQCGLASLTSITFDGDRVLRVVYSEPAGPEPEGTTPGA